MLLLNRGVLRDSTIMFESGGVPEDQFPLTLPRGGALGTCNGAVLHADVAVSYL